MRFNLLRKLILGTIILTIPILSSCNSDKKDYLAATNKINELYILYNNYNEIDKKENLEAEEFGDYVDLIELERDYLIKEQDIEIELAEKIEDILYFKIEDYSKDEVEQFSNSTKEISDLLEKKLHEFELHRQNYLKEINNLDVNKERKEEYLNLINDRMSIETNYMDNYHGLLVKFVDKLKKMGVVLLKIQENKDDTEYNLNNEFIMLDDIDSELQEISMNIINITLNYDERISKILEDDIYTEN